MKINWADVIGFLVMWAGTTVLFRISTDAWLTFLGIVIVVIGSSVMDIGHEIRRDEK